MRRRERTGAGRGAGRGGGRAGLAVAAAFLLTSAFAPGCAKELDASRVPRQRGTIGEEIYGVVCDRVAAQELREDLSGASFRGVCHKDATGAYADEVDEALLPPVREGAIDVEGRPVSVGDQARHREASLARVHALVRRRADLIEAFDATFPDVAVRTKDLRNRDPKKSCDEPATEAAAASTLGREFADMLGRMGPLYGDGTLPNSTQSLARLVDVFITSKDAQDTLFRFAQRKGYRPAEVALGVIQPTLAYPRLRDLAAETLRLTLADSNPYDPDPPRSADGKRIPVPGAAHEPLSNLLAAAREELRTATVDAPLRPLSVIQDTTARREVLSRPRSTLELVSKVLFAEDPSFGAGPARYIAKRDARGFAAVARVGGDVVAPFVDRDDDGLPDVDRSGLFLTASGEPPPTPFFSVDVPHASPSRDAFGRTLAGGSLVFDYLDTSHVFLTRLMTDTRALFDPDPDREGLMRVVAGVYAMMGPRTSMTKTFAPDPRARAIWELTHTAREPPPADLETRPVALAYEGHRNETAPLVDLVYALAQIAADRSVDDALLLSRELVTTRTSDVARLLGATLAFRDVANRHPEAKNAHSPTSLFWDEMLAVLEELTKVPNLLEDLLGALGDEATLPLSNVLAGYMKYGDHITYDRNNLNGPAVNLTAGGNRPMQTVVDRTQPDSGLTRSAFHRMLQAVHDVKGVTVCNKEGATVHAEGMPVIGSAEICYSSVRANSICNFSNRPFKECEVFKLENLASFYLNATIGRSELVFRPIVVRDGISGVAGATVSTIEASSGIRGFWDPSDSERFRPRPEWLNRLVFFDVRNDSPNPGDRNFKTNRFLRDLQGMHIPTAICPERVIDDPIVGNDAFYQGDVAPDRKIRGLRTCQAGDHLDERDGDSTFVWEGTGFFDAMAPIIRVFSDHKREDLLVEIMDIAYRHWQSDRGTPSECDPSDPKSPRYCAQDGLSSYEPLLSEALLGDMLPALASTKRVLETVAIPRCTAVNTNGVCTATTSVSGTAVIADVTRALLDADRARLQGLSDRTGGTTGLRNDGTRTPYLTPIYLLTQALNAIDAAFAENAARNPADAGRQAEWQRGRSLLVDQLFKVQGSGAGASFVNPAIDKLTPMLIDLVRAQIYAHCPEAFVPPYRARCAWARDELAKNVAEAVEGPLAAGAVAVMDAIRKDPAARRELERLMVYLLDESSKEQALPAVMAAATDLLQLIANDEDMVPMYHVLAEAAGGNLRDASGRLVQASLLDAQGALLARMSQRAYDKDGVEICAREIDPNQVMSIALKNLVTPLPGGTRDMPRKTPAEVILDVVNDVNRVAPERRDALDTRDYESIAFQVNDFLLDKERGLEQLYEIMRNGVR